MGCLARVRKTQARCLVRAQWSNPECRGQRGHDGRVATLRNEKAGSHWLNVGASPRSSVQTQNIAPEKGTKIGFGTAGARRLPMCGFFEQRDVAASPRERRCEQRAWVSKSTLTHERAAASTSVSAGRSVFWHCERKDCQSALRKPRSLRIPFLFEEQTASQLNTNFKVVRY